MLAPSIRERLQLLNKQNKMQVPLSYISDNSSATPLWAFLYLYSCNERQLRINYFAGAKALFTYLKPFSITPSIAKAAYHINNDIAPFNSWDLTQLATVLCNIKFPETHATSLAKIRHAEKVIFLTITSEVLPKKTCHISDPSTEYLQELTQYE